MLGGGPAPGACTLRTLWKVIAAALSDLVTAALAAASVAAPAAAERPPVRWDAIPYGVERRSDMKAYSRRHYGIDSNRLSRPRVIVQHMTEGSSYSSAWNIFARNERDSELGELPGVCTHFVIEKSGRISQLVPLSLMCRHTVGLNYTAIGIEHVGFEESGVMGNRRMRQASLRLTNWLRCRYGIGLSNVIGHNENLRSPYHRERVARLRTQTHGDWPAARMRPYRAALRSLSC